MEIKETKIKEILSKKNIVKYHLDKLHENSFFHFIKNNIKYEIDLYNDDENENVFIKMEQGQPINIWDLNFDELVLKIESEL